MSIINETTFKKELQTPLPFKSIVNGFLCCQGISPNQVMSFTVALVSFAYLFLSPKQMKRTLINLISFNKFLHFQFMLLMFATLPRFTAKNVDGEGFHQRSVNHMGAALIQV